MRHAAKRDDNEEAIVKALRRCGASVHRLDDKGVPDLLVGWCGKMFIIEVKGPKGRLTKAQKGFRKLWKGPPPATVTTEIEALTAIGALATRTLRVTAHPITHHAECNDAGCSGGC